MLSDDEARRSFERGRLGAAVALARQKRRHVKLRLSHADTGPSIRSLAQAARGKALTHLTRAGDVVRRSQTKLALAQWREGAVFLGRHHLAAKRVLSLCMRRRRERLVASFTRLALGGHLVTATQLIAKASVMRRLCAWRHVQRYAHRLMGRLNAISQHVWLVSAFMMWRLRTRQRAVLSKCLRKCRVRRALKVAMIRLCTPSRRRLIIKHAMRHVSRQVFRLLVCHALRDAWACWRRATKIRAGLWRLEKRGHIREMRAAWAQLCRVARTVAVLLRGMKVARRLMLRSALARLRFASKKATVVMRLLKCVRRYMLRNAISSLEAAMRLSSSQLRVVTRLSRIVRRRTLRMTLARLVHSGRVRKRALVLRLVRCVIRRLLRLALSRFRPAVHLLRAIDSEQSRTREGLFKLAQQLRRVLQASYAGPFLSAASHKAHRSALNSEMDAQQYGEELERRRHLVTELRHVEEQLQVEEAGTCAALTQRQLACATELRSIDLEQQRRKQRLLRQHEDDRASSSSAYSKHQASELGGIFGGGEFVGEEP